MANGIDYILRRLDERYEEEFIHQCKQAGWQSVMVHGAIFGSNKATLYFQVDKRCIKAVDYIEITKKQLIPNLVKKSKHIYINVIMHLHIQLKQLKQSLRHDATSIEEKSKLQNGLRIRFNPIEMVWAIMKRHMRYYKQQTFEEFITHVQEAWDSVSSLTIKKLTAQCPEEFNNVRQPVVDGLVNDE
ncbi:Transposable_element Tcb2 transposase [Hexamita inflata]|uniref:Transposable element Tcb2 transposase n=1 Tax=Hexamita inflata TaxID=28002 RepID=A0AA86V2K5_9EUKA|nr:Transposable element Tcb2 transposase [Hexamita inflata]